MSDPSSQPTQPLTDEEWVRIEEMTVRTPRMFDFGTRRLIATIQETRGALAVRRLEADRLRALVLDLYQDSPCTFDHHGYCQEHGWFETEPACPHSRIRALGLDQDGHGKGDPAETPHPDRPCPHEEFAALVAVNRIRADDDDATVVGYSADIKVDCQDCGEPFRWVGIDAGASPRGPMCSIDETELRAPLRPASADPDFGLGLPGFAVRANQSRGGGESHG